MELSKIAQNLGGSVIRQMFNEALKMTDTISFTVGEPDFVTPRPIIDEACLKWQAGLTHYTHNAGVIELRREIAKYEERLSPDPETQIIVTCGATEAIQMALFSVVNPGDEVILVTPAWPNYFGQIGMCGAVLKAVPAYEENNFVPDVADIRNAITEKTKAVILNSPSNPTGAVIDRDTMTKLAELFREHDLFVIADEVYNRLTYGDEAYTSLTSFEGLEEKVIYINGFSKMFAMTGWRLGYAISRPEIIKSMTKLHENGASCLPAPSQLAAALALRSCQDEIEKMRTIYEKRRDLMCGLMNQISGVSCRVPKGAFYVFANIQETGLSSEDFCMRLLRKTGVVTVPGSGFGEVGKGYVRFTYATSEANISEGLNRMKTFVESL